MQLIQSRIVVANKDEAERLIAEKEQGKIISLRPSPVQPFPDRVWWDYVVVAESGE